MAIFASNFASNIDYIKYLLFFIPKFGENHANDLIRFLSITIDGVDDTIVLGSIKRYHKEFFHLYNRFKSKGYLKFLFESGKLLFNLTCL